MEATAIMGFVSLAFQTAAEAITVYKSIRDSLAPADQAVLDADYNKMVAADQAVTDKLRATPDDPV